MDVPRCTLVPLLPPGTEHMWKLRETSLFFKLFLDSDIIDMFDSELLSSSLDVAKTHPYHHPGGGTRPCRTS